MILEKVINKYHGAEYCASLKCQQLNNRRNKDIQKAIMPGKRYLALCLVKTYVLKNVGVWE